MNARRLDGSRLRVAIDARPLSHPQPGGYKSYVRSLLRGLRERANTGQNDIELLLYIDRPLADQIQAALPPQTQTRVVGANRIRADWLTLGRCLAQDVPDLFFGVANYLPAPRNRMRSAFVLHDALGMRIYPWNRAIKQTARHQWLARYWNLMTRLSLKRARRIVTVSHGSARELAETLGEPETRFDVVYNGVTLPPSRLGLMRQKDSVLVFHAPDARKNADCAYQAFATERIGKTGPKLRIVCTGARAEAGAQQAVEQWKLSNAELLRGLDDQGVADAYAEAGALVWPSRWEGFGLPPLEAMQAGCPVVSSSAPVMPEILGDAPVYFDPDRPDELAQRWAALFANPDEQQERAKRGREIAAPFTCLRMANETVDVWHKAVTA